MSKKYKMAEAIGDMVGILVRKTHVDIGMYICSLEGAMGMFTAGKKDQFKEDYLDFLRESIKRIEEVIEHTENGNIDLTDDDHNKFIFLRDENKFVPIDEDEPGNEWEFPA